MPQGQDLYNSNWSRAAHTISNGWDAARQYTLQACNFIAGMVSPGQANAAPLQVPELVGVP
jgi:hypothetical protein